MLLDKIFILFGALFLLSYVLGKLFVFKTNDAIRVGRYVVLVTIFQGLNMLCGLGMLFFGHTLLFKTAILFYVISPFILGHLANYHTEKIYSAIQMLLVIMSITMCLVYS